LHWFHLYLASGSTNLFCKLLFTDVLLTGPMLGIDNSTSRVKLRYIPSDKFPDWTASELLRRANSLRLNSILWHAPFLLKFPKAPHFEQNAVAKSCVHFYWKLSNESGYFHHERRLRRAPFNRLSFRVSFQQVWVCNTLLDQLEMQPMVLVFQRL